MSQIKRGRGRPPKNPILKRTSKLASATAEPQSPSNSPEPPTRALRSSKSNSPKQTPPIPEKTNLKTTKAKQKQLLTAQPQPQPQSLEEATAAAETSQVVRKRGRPKKRANPAQNDEINPPAKRIKTSALDLVQAADPVVEEANSRQPELLPFERVEEIEYFLT